MKVDDLIDIDNATTVNLDPQVVAALNVFGFVSVTYSLYHGSGTPHKYVGIIVGICKDNSSQTWTGTGNTPDEAETNAIDALAKWLLNQPIPFYPAGVTP